MTGVGSSWSNGGDFLIALNGGGTLTVANGGTVSAVNGITIASAAGSVGTLNIGSLGGSDTAGTIVTPTIAFGAGTGAINFNQVDTATLTSSISGNGKVQQLGVGTTILTGDNTYSGGTTISAGALQVGNGGTSGSLGSGAVTDNASLIVNRSDAVSIANVISGTGSFTQAGDGTTTFTGANTYSGSTTVAAGELSVSSVATIAAGGVSVRNGATLENNGSIGGTTTVNSGGTLAGNGGSFGTVKMMGGSSLKWDVSSFTGAAGSAWDQLGATSLDLSDLSPLNQMTIYLIGTSGQGNPTTNSYSFAFFNTTGGVSGFNSSDFLFDTSGLTLDPTLVGGDWSVVLAADSLNLVYTSSVPEPSQVAASILLIAGIAGFVIVRRRKMAASAA